MRAVLLALLYRLEAIASEHEDLQDDRVQEAMSEAVFEKFLKLNSDYQVPAVFGMTYDEADKRAREALAEFLVAAQQAAQQDGLDTFHKRFAALRNPDVHTEDWSDAADFFGWWWDPADFDEFGNRKD